MFAKLTVTLLLVAACVSGWAQETVRKIQALDKVKVTCPEEGLLTKTYQVSKDGIILMDFLGAVEIAGLSDKEASDMISKKLVDDRILRKATVTVQALVEGQTPAPADDKPAPTGEQPKPAGDQPKPTQEQPKPAQDQPKAVGLVKFSGAVTKPGEVTYQDGMKLSDVVKAAGTLETTDLSGVTVKSPDGTVKTVDASKVENDITLKPGDEVVFAAKPVPVPTEVFVFGGVSKPGSVKLAGGLTVKNAIAAAGGFSDNAVKKKVRVERDGQPAQMLDFTVADADAPLKANDRVVVDVTESRSYVEIQGAVRNPGFFVVTPGMKLGAAINAAGGYMPKAKVDKIKVTPASGAKPYTVNFKEIEQGYSGDIVLAPGDKISVPSSNSKGPSTTQIVIGVAILWILFHR